MLLGSTEDSRCSLREELKEMKSRRIIFWDEAHQRITAIVLFILVAVLSLAVLIDVFIRL